MYVKWNDVDYMDGRKDFTVDNGSFNGLSEFVDEVHGAGIYWIVFIVDFVFVFRMSSGMI